MTLYILRLPVALILASYAISIASAGGNCGGASRCCPGRDASCLGAPDLKGHGGHCYCDEGCLETGDCCDDYKKTCNVKVVDCEVSKWSEWGRCDAMCGKGKQTRKRIITRHPSPGGARCGQLEQKRNCLGTRCSRRYLRYKNPIRETAGLLPAKFLRRYQKPKWDVRQNLFKHSEMEKIMAPAQIGKHGLTAVMTNDIAQGYQSDQPPNTQYCIVFELTKVTKACRMDRDFHKMKKGSEMCAICPSAAKRQSLGGRCKGHGVDSELTRWRSTVKPKCHGKWRRLYQVGDCPCKTGADFIFV